MVMRPIKASTRPQETVMSLRTKLVSTVVALTVTAGALATATQPSAAGSLSKGEIAALAGVGGFIAGSVIANANRGPYYRAPYYRGVGYASSWDYHVQRCLARYRTYDPYSDTFVGYDGYRHRCRL
jgi:hypothetical protein